MKLTAKNFSLEFNADGRAVRFENLLTGETYPIYDEGEYYILDGAEIGAGKFVTVDLRDDGARFTFENFTVSWTIHKEYLEKRVFIKITDSGVLEKVGVMELCFPEAAELHFHDDCTIWHCPMCTYARHKKGGVYYGLAYPYWEDSYAMAFAPYVRVEAGETFVSEVAFIGATEFTGKRIISHGPYHRSGDVTYFPEDWQHHSGLPQHFVQNRVPDDVGIPDEIQDAGEISAMREFFREFLGRWPLPEDGYLVWQNGWWAGLNKADKECIDMMERIGVKDIMTAAMYFGHANHPSCEPGFIKDTTFDPLRFPKVQGKGEDITTLSDGHHHTVKSSDEGASVMEYTAGFDAPADYDEMISYGREKGVHVTSFSTPNNSYTAYPEWLSLNEDGEAYKYFGTKLSCPASREYMDHHFEMLCSVIDRYSPRMFFFDGRWMGYREVCCGVYPSVGEDPCFSDNHGHLPGKSRYQEWKNIEDFKRRLRDRYPNMGLEQYYGMKRGSTWALSYYNSDENYYEVAGADDTRFQTWHNEHDRFRPTYMHFANIMGRDTESFKYDLISAISTSSYAQIAGGYHALKESDECVEFLKKWREWASENSRYLGDRESLFGCPGSVPVDGSAHMIDGEGFVFLFNVTDADRECELPLSDIPGLGEGALPQIIYPYVCPMEADGHGVLRIPMKGRSAMIVQFKKA